MTDHLQDFPIDIVVFAIVAIGLGWRLYVVLGRKGTASPIPGLSGLRGGRSAPQRVPPAAKPAEVAAPVLQVPKAGTRVGDILAGFTKTDRHFQPQSFLREVERGFATIVLAYASGDRAALQRFLTPAAFGAFERAIEAREQAGQTQKVEIRTIVSLEIEDAAQQPGSADWIEVRIVSQQISLVLGADGQPVSGTDAVTEFSDLWRLERMSGSPETLWRLAAARAA